jgi:hypothetical protein
MSVRDETLNNIHMVIMNAQPASMAIKISILARHIARIVPIGTGSILMMSEDPPSMSQ